MLALLDDKSWAAEPLQLRIITSFKNSDPYISKKLSASYNVKVGSI